MSSIPATPDGVRSTVDPRRWAALAVLLLAVVMDLWDVSVVNVAIPSIQRDLGGSYAQVQWIVAGYTLAFALLLITGGRLGDLLGRKRMFLAGVVGFTIASGLCGAAQSPEALIAFRVVQGAMAAAMLPQVLSIIQVAFPAQERSAAFGMYGAFAGLATVAGPLLGGLLIHIDVLGLQWRAIFLINIPIGLGAFAGASMLVPESRASGATRLDFRGVVLVSAGLLLVLYPLVEGRQLGWPAWTFAAMATAVPVLVCFALHERRAARRGKAALVPPRLFTQRAFLAGLGVSVTYFLGVTSFFLVFSIFLQSGLGFSALHSALTTAPSSLGLAAAAGLSVKLGPRFGRALLIPGAALTAAGVGAVILAVRIKGGTVSSLNLAPGLLVFGLGLGTVAPPLVDIVLIGVREQDAGAASGVLNTTFQLGGAIGVAALGVIFFSQLSHNAASSEHAATPKLRAELQAVLPPSTHAPIIAGFAVCFHDRAASSDPSAMPTSCRSLALSATHTPGMQSVAARPARVDAATTARRLDFATSIQRTLWCEIAALLACSLLMLLLPSKPTTPSAGGQRSAAATRSLAGTGQRPGFREVVVPAPPS